jgi:hypothetical protein
MSTEKSFGSSRTTTKALNIAGGILMGWAVFFPVPYFAVMVGCLVLPLVSVFVMSAGKGMVKLNAARRSKDPNVAIAFIGPCIALCLRAVFDFQFVSYKPAWVPTLSVGLALTAWVYIYAPDIRPKPLNMLLVFPFALCYGYGLFVMSNCLVDSSRPAEYSTQITNKRVSTGSRGGNYYYVDILPCGPLSTTQEVRVSRRGYESYAKGQPLLLKVKDGTLGAKWFYIVPQRR